MYANVRNASSVRGESTSARSPARPPRSPGRCCRSARRRAGSRRRPSRGRSIRSQRTVAEGATRCGRIGTRLAVCPPGDLRGDARSSARRTAGAARPRAASSASGHAGLDAGDRGEPDDDAGPPAHVAVALLAPRARRSTVGMIASSDVASAWICVRPSPRVSVGTNRIPPPTPNSPARTPPASAERDRERRSLPSDEQLHADAGEEQGEEERERPVAEPLLERGAADRADRGGEADEQRRAGLQLAVERRRRPCRRRR